MHYSNAKPTPESFFPIEGRMKTDHFDARAAKLLKAGDYIALTPHPGLRLVASATRRAWVYRYKIAETGYMKQVKLGEWPARTFAQAVDEWEKARAARDAGRDPAAEKRTKVKTDRTVAKTASLRESMTCAKVVEQYMTELIVPIREEKGMLETRRMLKRAIATAPERLADDISREDAHDMILSIAKTAPRVAAMTRQELRAAWEHGITVGRLKGINPFLGKTIGGRLNAKKRDRTLDTREIGALLRWFREPGAYSRTVVDALELTLRTGLRSGEVVATRIDEVRERNGALWIDIPGSRMKKGKAHSTPLVGRARSIVDSRMVDGATFLFPSRDGSKAIEQKVLGVEVYACSGRSKASAYAQRRVCPVKSFTPHDLRRTARSVLAEMGCPFEVGESILAHELPGVAANYVHSKFETAKVEWLTRLGEHIDALEAARNVVQLKPKRAA